MAHPGSPVIFRSSVKQTNPETGYSALNTIFAKAADNPSYTPIEARAAFAALIPIPPDVICLAQQRLSPGCAPK